PSNPSARAGHVMAYDHVRHRVVLFGGKAADGNFLADTWEWDGVRWNSIVSPTTPPARARHAMAFDAVRARVVMFGGDRQLFQQAVVDTPEYADTWLWDGATWTRQLTASFPACSVNAADGRGGAAMAFDPARGVMTLFGGDCRTFNGSESLLYPTDGELWLLDAAGWRSASVAAGKPPTRASAQLAFDVVTQTMVLFGGLADQWRWNGTGWTEDAIALPPTRTAHAMAADPDRGRVVVFGGATASPDPRTWEWDGSAWSAHQTVLPALAGAEVAFDTRRGVAVVVDENGATYELHGTSWTQGPSVPLRGYNALAYDEARGITVLYTSFLVAETWLWDGTTWTLAAPATSPPVRFTTALAYDLRAQRVIMFGGFAGGVSVGDMWAWDGTTWGELHPDQLPPARNTFPLTLDRTRGELVLFGGKQFTATTSGAVLDDTWVWDGSSWHAADSTPRPEARHSAALVDLPARGHVVLHGGLKGGGEGLADTWEWSGKTWTPVAVPPTPGSRAGALVVPEPDGSGALVFGGYRNAYRDANGDQLPLTDAWQLRWQGPGVADTCGPALDLDRDGQIGCGDADCRFACDSCGDGTCESTLESCQSCPGDCGPCPTACGDARCDGGETATTCPGDC
ncbi:MAG: kelch repeat-containing protein, partial [Proteobacteria bacterium]|nr:kelch repeat-containing protein [Pseudomonadota bacterium]